MKNTVWTLSTYPLQEEFKLRAADALYYILNGGVTSADTWIHGWTTKVGFIEADNYFTSNTTGMYSVNITHLNKERHVRNCEWRMKRKDFWQTPTKHHRAQGLTGKQNSLAGSRKHIHSTFH